MRSHVCSASSLLSPSHILSPKSKSSFFPSLSKPSKLHYWFVNIFIFALFFLLVLSCHLALLLAPLPSSFSFLLPFVLPHHLGSKYSSPLWRCPSVSEPLIPLAWVFIPQSLLITLSLPFSTWSTADFDDSCHSQKKLSSFLMRHWDANC